MSTTKAFIIFKYMNLKIPRYLVSENFSVISIQQTVVFCDRERIIFNFKQFSIFKLIFFKFTNIGKNFLKKIFFYLKLYFFLP